MRSQYFILGYFEIMLDFMIKYKIKELNIVSSSAFLLLYVGIFLTSNIYNMLIMKNY